MGRRDTGGSLGDRTDVGRAARWHIAAFATIGVATVGFLAASLFDAPLVSILLVGLLLVCPLMMWAPFRLERASRQHPRPDRKGRTGSRM